MNDFGVTLIWLSLQITALCILAAAIYGLARRGNPKVGAAATLSTLLLISVLSAAAFAPGPSWMDRGEAPAPTAATETETPGEAAAGEAATASGTTATGDGWLTAAVVSDFLRDFEQRIQQPVELPAESWHWTGWFAVAFCIGLGIGGARLLLGLVSVARLRRSSRRIDDAEADELLAVICAGFSFVRPVTICESNGVSSAATIGWRRPLVLLPSDWRDWSREELRTVLAHEVAHIAHRDFPCWLAAQVGVLLHFYHPLVHWLAGRLRLEQELAADADAARHSGGPKRYLRNLAELAVRQADRPVPWPARTFLPSRGTLLRRVEMLRDRTASGASSPGWRRGATITAMLLAGLLLAGVRQPGDSAQAQELPVPKILTRAQAEAQKAQAEAQKKEAIRQAALARAALLQPARPAAAGSSFDLRYVPAASTMMVATRPARLATQKDMKPLVPMLEQTMMTRMGMKFADLDQVIMLGFQVEGTASPLGPQPVVVITLAANSKARTADIIKALARGETSPKTHNGMNYQLDASETSAFYVPNPKTLISGRANMVTWLMDATKDGPGRHTWGKDFQSVADNDFAYVLDVTALLPEIKKQMGRQAENPIIAAFSPLWEETELLVVGAKIVDDSSLTVAGVCRSTEGAQKVQQTVQSLVPLGKNALAGLKQQLRSQPADQQKQLSQLVGFGEDLLDGLKVTQEGKKVGIQVTSDKAGVPLMIAVLLPAVQSAREAARRAQDKNNLKQIGQAFHNYADTHKKLPHSAMVGPDGKTKHSWRVAILPYIGEAELYNEYNLNEPWNSEDNRKVLAKMPDVYRNPNSTGDKTHCSYFGLVGKDTAFGDNSQDLWFRDFTDGTSNTILVVEAQREVPWTKPEDIPYDPEKKLPKLGGYHPGGLNVLITDGSVRFLSDTIDKTTLRALITRNGKEVINEF